MIRAIAALLIVVTAAAAAVVPGCDRVVDLTPFHDARPALDAHPDGGFAVDVGRYDGPAFDDGGIAPGDDASAGADAAAADGHAPDDGTARAR